MTDKEFFDVWITKYALTSGITKAQAYSVGDGMIHLHPRKQYEDPYFHKKDFVRSEAEALQCAEEMREKKLASLRKQLNKLEKMTFKIKERS